ncbi:MAG: MaoC/PaaZ C-terminal domain-containing protein [Ornithinimicrobium sp.]
MTPTLSALSVGQIVAATSIHVDRAQLRDYANASGDQNPIHQDESVARSVGLPDVIAHGMWTMGAALEVVCQWAGDPTAVISYSTRFTQPVPVPADGGADIVVKAVVKKVDTDTGHITLELAVTCGEAKVLGRALAVVATELVDTQMVDTQPVDTQPVDTQPGDTETAARSAGMGPS